MKRSDLELAALVVVIASIVSTLAVAAAVVVTLTVAH